MKHFKPLPPFEEVGQHLRYDSATGLLWWNNQGARGGRKLDRPAGSLLQNGYLRLKLNDIDYKAHRIAWLLASGDDPGSMQVDHRNGIRHDNRIINLRLATTAENAHNCKRACNNTSGYKGVCWSRKYKRWQAQICLNRKLVFLGYHKTAHAAHLAYTKAALDLRGEFARLE